MPTFSAVAPLLLPLLACFILGSIPFAVLAMLGTGIDIRRVGSGNPGFNNVLRVNKPRAVIALIGDLGKGALAVGLFYQAGDPITLGWLYGIAAILGHCYSPFLKFKGGKGIATSAGVMLVLYPFWIAISVPVYVLGRWVGSKLQWREAGALSSIVTCMTFAILLTFFVGTWDGICAGILTLLLVWRHKKNFQNMLVGAKEESKP
ncbi:MAG TPA: glycerol-3-phosphate acyltransferase [Terriglobia bacterium]|nr:glycerol-3-phosphate acyltransferase [Terriglobia bacterium]